jgi:hypothetical protein
VCIYIYGYIYTYIYIRICICVYTHTHTPTHAHIHTHKHLHTQTHLERCRQALLVALEVLNLLVQHLALSEGRIELLLERPDLVIEFRLRLLELVLCLLPLLSEA